MPPPLISVLVPTRNRAHLLAETLDSVLGQTWGDFELLISNNGSTDDTEEIMHSYATRDQRIRLLRPPADCGYIEHWNWGWSQMRGTYGTLLSDDDVWLPRFLEVCVHEIKTNPDIDVIGSDYALWHSKEDKRELRHLPTHTFAGIVQNPLAVIIAYNFFGLNCLLMRRTMFEELRGYGPLPNCDTQLFLKAAFANKIFFAIPEVHLDCRVHGIQLTASALKTRIWDAELFEHYTQVPVGDWRKHFRLRRAAGGTWANVGDLLHRHHDEPNLSEPMHYYLRGLRVCPWHPAPWKGIVRALFQTQPRRAQGT